MRCSGGGIIAADILMHKPGEVAFYWLGYALMGFDEMTKRGLQCIRNFFCKKVMHFIAIYEYRETGNRLDK